MRSRNTDVLFWASIKPNKRGSFEDFMLLLSQKAQQENIDITFVFGEELGKHYQGKGMDYRSVDIASLVSPWFLSRTVRRLRPRCIHFHFVSYVSALPWLSRRMGAKSVLYTDHNSSLPRGSEAGLISRLKFSRRRWYLGRIDHAIGVSDFVAARYRPYGLSSKGRVRTIHNGIDLKRFYPAANNEEMNFLKKELLGLHNSETVITYAGQFIAEKGVLVYAKAVKALLGTCDNLCFVFVGAGPLYNDTIRMLEGHDPSKLRFLDPRDDLENIFRASDILAIPSTWEEAFGLVGAEASACGIPVVASDIGGIPEVVVNEVTGVLTPPGDESLLLQALLRLIREPALRQKMGDAGRKHAEKHFSLEDRVTELLELYKQCLV